MPESVNETPPRQREKVNAAKRLHDALVTIRSTEGLHLYAVLPVALNIAKPSHVVDHSWAAIEAFSLIGRMLKDVAREINQSRMSEDDQVFYEQSFPGICAAMSPAACGQAWAEARKKITDVDLTRLDNLDRVLRRYVREQTVEAVEFESLLITVDEALDALNESALPIRLADFIKSRLLDIRTATSQYKYRGMTGVEEALAGYVGALGMSGNVITEHMTEDRKSKLADVLKTGNALVTLAHGTEWAWPYLVAVFQGAEKLLLP